ncbi:acyl-CoA dehydrogenase [Tianweitania sp. BSSL-BM11]|uniref:Acyl-CoA dehydrogenase n=1 Tax=Tianweitania aestuarii TaxID=2814886 RepID=A0ABS5RYD0_9HYPH|nr:acyl-CoA dehydrogenase family protein [Tianweitania aestuarii]MBS9722023.1 acyl-CoA dehydrogenase [Tianweitania aestuarii]
MPSDSAAHDPYHQHLHLALRSEAAERDRDRGFPQAGFDALQTRGLLGDPPLEPSQMRRLLRLLAKVGRGDLPTGRIYEGHVNALDLVRRHGTAAQRSHYQALADKGHVFGIWNTDQPGYPLHLEDGRLGGAKNYASGVDGLSHAIVTVTRPEGRVMIIAPLDGLPVDRSWWKPMGMHASGSHVVDFSGLAVTPDMILGKPDSYLEQPWFFAGAIRFVAVHVGGMHAVFDAAVEHLRATKRIGDPYQSHRVARMGTAVESGYAWLDRAAAEWASVASGDGNPDALVATVNGARGAVEGFALSVLEDAERGVGAAGMIAPHPLERLIRDLRTYLRQPNPDGAQQALGSAIANGAWEPGWLNEEAEQ